MIRAKDPPPPAPVSPWAKVFGGLLLVFLLTWWGIDLYWHLVRDECMRLHLAGYYGRSGIWAEVVLVTAVIGVGLEQKRSGRWSSLGLAFIAFALLVADCAAIRVMLRS